MHLRILAVSDEPYYTDNLLPSTLVDIVKVLGERGCNVCLVQPGSSNWLRREKLFRVITFSRIPKYFNGFFKALQRSNETLFKTATSSLNPKVYQILWEQSRSSDVIMCYDVQYALPAIIAAKIARKPVILLGDILYISYYRGLKDVSSLQLLMLLAWEKTVEHLSDRIAVWGPDDKRFLLSSGIAKRKIKIIPLSIDLKKIELLTKQPNEELPYRRLRALKEKGFRILMFHGNLNYAPNQLSVDFILQKLSPALLKKYSDIVFAIVGTNPRKSQNSSDRIVFTGRVNNLFSFIDLADLAIVPLTVGTGVKNKVLEYFALSKPVVTTKIGAENLSVKNMFHCLITDIEGFPDKVSYLLENPELLVYLGQNGRKYVGENHQLQNYERYAELAKDLLKSNIKK
jgi:glycosyltransferase involved in cell wall biosynthesis